MAIANLERSRQTPLVAYQEFDYSDLNAAGALGVFNVVNLPPNAIVLRGDFVTTTEFDGTAVTVSLGDVGGDDDRYVGTPLDIKAVGVDAITPDGQAYTEATTVAVYVDTLTGTHAAGEGYVRLEYIVVGRGGYNQAA